MEPLALFIKQALHERPYEEFCQQNGLHAFHDLPMMLLKTIKRGATFDAYIQTNQFVPPPLKDFLTDIHATSLRRFWTVRRALVRWARRRRPSQTSMDLSLSPFGAPKTFMNVFDQGKKYTFKVSDLLNLIHSSLTHSMEFICDPVAIKNPYTGLQFKKPTLYSIYLMLRESAYAVPPLFSLFVGVDFEIDTFEIRYESLLRDHIIKATIDNMPASKRRTEIREMMRVVGVYNPLCNRHEPIFRLKAVQPEELDQFTPWLHLYFLHLYSLNTYYAHVSFRQLIQRMLEFRHDYPFFGVVFEKRGV